MKLFRRLAVLLAVAAMAVTSTTPASSQAPPIPAFANTACPEVTDSIVRLYSAYFLRPPDQTGFESWRDLYETSDWNLNRISGFFATSDEFVARYGSRTNAEFVDLIYTNLFSRPADPDGRAFWIGQLDSGARDRGTVMLNFSESEEYVLLTNSVTPLAGFFNSYPVGSTFQCGFGSSRVDVGTGTRYIDIAFFNTTTTEAQYDVRSVQRGQLRDEIIGATIQPLDTDAFFNRTINITTALDFTLPSTVGWMVVISPTPLPDDRAGWIRAAQGAALRAN